MVRRSLIPWIAAVLPGCGQSLEYQIDKAYVLPCVDMRCSGTVSLIALTDFVQSRPAVGDGETERINAISARSTDPEVDVFVEGMRVLREPTLLDGDLVKRANTALIFRHEDFEGVLEATPAAATSALTISIEYELAVTRDTGSFIP